MQEGHLDKLVLGSGRAQAQAPMYATLFRVLDSDIQGNAQGSKDPDGEAIHHHTCPV